MNIDKTLEFDKIKERWAELAATKTAKEQIRNMTFFLSEAELRKNMTDTTNSRRLLEEFGTPPLAASDEIPEILTLASAGSPLTPYQLERTAAFLSAVGRLRDYLNRGKQSGNSLAYYEENLDALDDLREEISQQIRGGEVDSHASRELLRIRSEILKTEEKMKQAAEQVIRAHKDCMADAYCTYRNGHLCIPVKKEYKLKISGSVIDKSSTGSTLFMEPSATAKYYETLQQLQIDEENEVYRILYTLTVMVSDSAPVMKQNMTMMEKLDFIFSKGKLSIDMQAVEPKINTTRHLYLKNARHPLMSRDVCVPLNLDMSENRKGIIITGPNTGGKTVSIKTVALNCLMAQCGLHVACEEADICMNNAYFCDIGDGQNLAENLSTFSAHIKIVLEIIGKISAESFVVMDELGSGTDPAEGMGIAIAILEELKKSGCLFLVTTHYPEVKEYAQSTDNIVNARMTFDKDTLSPTYQMIIGEAGESCAFYIAERFGMPPHMLETARHAAYGNDAVSLREVPETSGMTARTSENPTHSSLRLPETAPVSAPPTTSAPAKIKRMKPSRPERDLSAKFRRGDSVMIYPDKKIGIVCEPPNEKGALRVQLPDKKIWINHKRVKLQVAASELYPDDYDFSIVFDTVENRKTRHEMSRKLTDKIVRTEAPE